MAAPSQLRLPQAPRLLAPRPCVTPFRHCDASQRQQHRSAHCAAASNSRCSSRGELSTSSSTHGSSQASGWRLSLQQPASAAAAAVAACLLAAAPLSAAPLTQAPGQQADCFISSLEEALPSTDQRQQSWQRHSGTTQRIAEVAGLFGFGGDEGGDDPVDPFTLYGTTFKRFFIDKLDGEKIVSRRRGFTVETCTAAIAASEEKPSFQGLPTGARVNAIGNRKCRAAIDSELRPACAASCSRACQDGVDSYASESRSDLGFRVSDKAREKVLRGCRRQCSYECAKPGKAYDFVVPYRQ